MDRIRSNREWKVPPCVNSHELVAEQDLNTITDYGYVYTLKVDSGCLRSIINENSMVEFVFPPKILNKEKDNFKFFEVLPLFSNPFDERIRGFEALSHRNTTRSPGLGCSPASQLLRAYKELTRMP